MKDGLYHSEIGIPAEALNPFFAGRTFRLDYTRHAKHAAISDRYGPLTKAPLSLTINPGEVFEAQVESGRVVKFAVRLTAGFSAASPDVDLVLVLMPTGGLFLTVKTLWLNKRTDKHVTLDRNKYTTL